MKKVGLTGGIGSGKTIVSQIFSLLNIPIFNSDKEAKLLMIAPPLKNKIIDLLGYEAYTTKGELNKQYIGQLIFSNSTILSKINTLVHPEVEKSFCKFVQKNSNADYIIKEAAILFESGSYKKLDAIVLVYSDKETRIQRVIDRDTLTRNDILKKINTQMSDKKKIELSDYIIKNNNELIIPQIIKIHKTLLKQ